MLGLSVLGLLAAPRQVLTGTKPAAQRPQRQIRKGLRRFEQRLEKLFHVQLAKPYIFSLQALSSIVWLATVSGCNQIQDKISCLQGRYQSNKRGLRGLRPMLLKTFRLAWNSSDARVLECQEGEAYKKMEILFLKSKRIILATPCHALSQIKRLKYTRRLSNNPISFFSRIPPSFPSRTPPNPYSRSIYLRKLPLRPPQPSVCS